jgi:hypothetical protein
MAIGVIWYPPVDQQAYEAIRDKVLPGGQEKDMRFHAAERQTGSGGSSRSGTLARGSRVSSAKTWLAPPTR